MAEPVKYIWISPLLLDDEAIHAMDDHEYVTKFKAATRGEKNELSRYVRYQKTRPRPLKEERWAARRDGRV